MFEDESGAKTVSKSFAITARSPEACKKNQFSGLGPTKAYALEVSILKVLEEKRNASSYVTRKCRDRYFPKLLARRDPQDQNLTFVQTWDGVPLSQKYPISEFNKKFCDLSRDYVARFAKCATSVMRKARVEHLDSFDVATAAKNTVLHDGKLTLIDFDIATLFGFPRTRELVDRRELDQKSYADLLTELHGEVCTANTGAAARAAAARARWNRPVT